MNRRRLLSIVLKELRQLRRDKRTLRLFLIAPVIQLTFFGYAISTDLKGVKLGVVIEDPSPEARRLVDAIVATRAFDLIPTASARPDDLRPWLDTGAAQIALHIPPGFARALARGQAPVVQVLSDGSDSNTATLAFQYLSGAARVWASRERQDYLRRHPSQAVRFARVPQVNLEPRFWYNPDLKSVDFQIPGVLALILLALGASQTSLMVVRERELGTLEQLSVTPIHAWELLVGKTIPMAGAGLVMTLLITVVAYVWFHVPLRGSIPFLLIAATLYLLNTLGIGLLISVISRTQLQAQITTSFLMTPLIMLSGFLFPIANMPQWAQWLTVILPTRYYMEVVRGVFLKGQGAAELWPQAVVLAILGVLLYLGGILSFRKRVD
ncbi:MAG: ABC transporter permease [Armatimonadetes bacterium]|nr:ABC transporter permease [Armatimonadota bacterium]